MLRKTGMGPAPRGFAAARMKRGSAPGLGRVAKLPACFASRDDAKQAGGTSGRRAPPASHSETRRSKLAGQDGIALFLEANFGRVAELADARVLGTRPVRGRGSSPLSPTRSKSSISRICGSSSEVEHHVANVRVAGSNPVSRSTFRSSARARDGQPGCARCQTSDRSIHRT